MSTVPRALLLSALLTLVPVSIGVVMADDTTPERKPAAYEGTDLADFDSSAAFVQRVPFCDLVPGEAVTAALGAANVPDGEKADLTAYGNGEESDALPGGDVAHEYGCRFTGADPAAGDARGWVFAPPVVADRAKALVAAASSPRCEVQPKAPAYGAPSVAVVCTGGETRTASFRGLFGDAWLACSLTLSADVDQAELVSRTGRWCVAVAQAAAVATD